jgi:hypothetical protein
MIVRRSLFAALLLLATYTTVSGSWRYSAMVQTERISDLTESKRFEHTIPADYDGTRFIVRVRLTEGAVTIRLRDEKNVQRWARTYRKGDFNVTQDFPGVTGEWRVYVDFKNASGKYTVKLEDY